MTFQSASLLRHLKTAQVCEDNSVAIDFETMRAWTIPYDPQEASIKEVKIKHCNGSIVSKLDYLKDLNYIDYDYYTGQAHVTHTGWNAIKATIGSAINFTVKDILIPVAVSVLTAVITTAILN